MNIDNIREAFEEWYWENMVRSDKTTREELFYRSSNGYLWLEVSASWHAYRAAHAASEKRIAELTEMYEEVLVDMRRLTKEIDSILTKGNPAEQASLCDIVHQARFVMAEMTAIQADNKRLVEVVQEFCDWNVKYPSSRIFSHYEIGKITSELDAIYAKAREALPPVEPLEDK